MTPDTRRMLRRSGGSVAGGAEVGDPARIVALLGVVLVTAAGLVGCGGGATTATPTPASGRVIHVPGDQATVQAALDRARPGDVVLLAAGTYRDPVTISRPGVTLRGVDRNTVVFDGGYRKETAITVAADGGTVENLTVHGYNANGVFVSGAAGKTVDPARTFGVDDDVLKGWRVSYVTSYDNGLYGIYAFASRYGRIDHSYASGHPDSGLYVGQCKPCDTVVTDSTAVGNAIGYYGTNASGGVYVIRSVFRGNRVGVTPNSQKMEKLAPQSETVVAGNLVIDNDNPQSPAVPKGAFGLGIAIGGGTRNTVLRNRVEGNAGAGIILTDLDDYPPENNRIEGNLLADNGADLAWAVADGAKAAGNCFTGNTFAASLPADIEKVLPCDGSAPAAGTPSLFRSPAAPPDANYKTLPAPPAQPSMPDANAPASVPTQVAPKVDLATITVPARPA